MNEIKKLEDYIWSITNGEWSTHVYKNTLLVINKEKSYYITYNNGGYYIDGKKYSFDDVINYLGLQMEAFLECMSYENGKGKLTHLLLTNQG